MSVKGLDTIDKNFRVETSIKKEDICFYDGEDGYESVLDFENAEERIITINFPLYSDVRKLYIGMQDNGSVDNTHPTDSGFLSMSLALEEVFEQILKQE